jgi:hypothetical protein
VVVVVFYFLVPILPSITQSLDPLYPGALPTNASKPSGECGECGGCGGVRR